MTRIITIGMLAVSLLLGVAVTSIAQSQGTFTDVPPDATGYQAIENMVAAGFISGKTDTTFEPDAPLTRRHVAIIFDRILKEYFPNQYPPIILNSFEGGNDEFNYKCVPDQYLNQYWSCNGTFTPTQATIDSVSYSYRVECRVRFSDNTLSDWSPLTSFTASELMAGTTYRWDDILHISEGTTSEATAMGCR